MFLNSKFVDNLTFYEFLYIKVKGKNKKIHVCIYIYLNCKKLA